MKSWILKSNKKTPDSDMLSGVLCNLPDDDLLSQELVQLSSALRRFTVLFGMGRSGSTLLWSSSEACIAFYRALSRLAIRKKHKCVFNEACI